LYRNAALFLTYLKQVDKMSTKVEEGLHKSMKNKELIQMLKLEKSLVYFATSLKSNEVVMEKLLRMTFIKKYPDDLDLLEDVIIENKQAIEMCNIYRDILKGTMDAFASIISNNLNIVMKLLTSLTVIIAIPTLIASLWGMNVPVPFKDNIFGFAIVLGIALVCSLISVIFMLKKKMM
jgi:magnesium transporter